MNEPGARSSITRPELLLRLSLTGGAWATTFQHEGLEFLHMLEGEVVYRRADKLFTMQPGDSLFFDADAPHGPERLVHLPARYLSIISYPRVRFPREDRFVRARLL